VIYAQIYDRSVMRQLSLSYGVYADYVMMDITHAEPLRNTICRLIGDNKFNDDDLIIILAGRFGIAHGASYIEISTAANFKSRCG
jgi:pyruvate kinase